MPRWAPVLSARIGDACRLSECMTSLEPPCRLWGSRGHLHHLLRSHQLSRLRRSKLVPDRNELLWCSALSLRGWLHLCLQVASRLGEAPLIRWVWTRRSRQDEELRSENTKHTSCIQHVGAEAQIYWSEAKRHSGGKGGFAARKRSRAHSWVSSARP